MAYISDETIQEVRDAIDMVDLVGEYLPLKRSGRNYTACCPFHHEKTPSFFVTPERQTYKCFGCGESGDGIRFVMQMDHLTFMEAVEKLAERYHIPITHSQQEGEKINRRKRDYEINRTAMIFYYKQFLTSSAPQRYLAGRQMGYEIINDFFLGYADASGNSLYNHLRSKGYEDEELLNLGLISRSNRGTGFYDRFRNRLMFPIISEKNRIIGFGGRILGEGMPKYLNSPESEIFQKGEHLYGLNIVQKHRSDRILLVEGYMDVIALHYHGLPFAVASLGTSLTEDQARLIGKYDRKIYLCYDGDQAGIKASRRAIEVFAKVNIAPKLVLLPDGLDPDDYCRKYGSDGFLEKMDQAIEPQDFELKLIAIAHDPEDDAKRPDFVREVTVFLAGIEQAAIRDLYIEKAADLASLPAVGLRTDVLAYREMVRQNPVRKKQRHIQKEAEPVQEHISVPLFQDPLAYLTRERDQLEYEVVRLLSLNRECRGLLEEEIAYFLKDPQYLALIERILRMQDEGVPVTPALLSEGSGPELSAKLLRLEEDEKRRLPAEMLSQNARELKKRIAHFQLRERKQEIMTQLRKDFDPKRSTTLFQELAEIDERLRAEGGGKHE